MAGLAMKLKPEITSRLCPFLSSTELGGKESELSCIPGTRRGARLPPASRTPWRRVGTHLGASIFWGQAEPPRSVTLAPGSPATALQLTLFLRQQGP